MYNILICDDDIDIVNALKIYLSDAEYNLFDAENGIDAINILNIKDIHLILMDIMMPKMDGMNVLVELQGGTFDLYIDGNLFKVIIGFALEKNKRMVFPSSYFISISNISPI